MFLPALTCRQSRGNLTKPVVLNGWRWQTIAMTSSLPICCAKIYCVVRSGLRRLGMTAGSTCIKLSCSIIDQGNMMQIWMSGVPPKSWIGGFEPLHGKLQEQTLSSAFHQLWCTPLPFSILQTLKARKANAGWYRHRCIDG
jgi:hypothetical protein